MVARWRGTRDRRDKMADLLLELFSEEIPARMQKKASEDLKKLVTDGLVEAGLTYESAGAFVTPRRLVLSVTGLVDRSPDLREERKGPRVDAPEKAIEGFCRGAGVSREQLEVRDEKKGQVFFALIEKPGRPAAEIVAEVVPAVVRGFPWPKSMRWGAGTLKWVRPLHSILCVLHDEEGAEVVPFDVDGIESGDVTYGHRFHAPEAIRVRSFEQYRAELANAHVVLDAAERADTIWNDAVNQAFALGLEVVEDHGLLAEVAGLVEWPVVLMGDIAEDFLGLPPEVLHDAVEATRDNALPDSLWACFQTPLSMGLLTESYVVAEEVAPTNPVSSLPCFDAQDVIAAVTVGDAVAFMGERDVIPGVDRIVAVYQDGRAVAWNQRQAR